MNANPSSSNGAPIAVKLPDGNQIDLPAGATIGDVAEAIGPGLARKAVGAMVKLTDSASAGASGTSGAAGGAASAASPAASVDGADSGGASASAAPGGSASAASTDRADELDTDEAGDSSADAGGGRYHADGFDILGVQDALAGNAEVRILTSDNTEALPLLHHSAAHVMADAIRRLWPGTKLWVGPPITRPFPGFYYDVECPHQITNDDLAAIEAEMKKIVKAKAPFEKRFQDRAQAIAHFTDDEPDPYKVDLLQRFDDAEVSFYRHGETFEDLCAGPHIPHTGHIKALKLMRVAGAYWKGDANNQMLQRIYGTAFFKKDDLKALLDGIAEAERRDHRRLGKELDLFSFSEFAPAMPFFHPRGVAILDALLAFSRREHVRRGYVEIRTPEVLADDLWRTSGHLDNYADNMYFTHYSETEAGEGATGDEDRDRGRRFGIKPMNCPGCMLYFKSKHHSYAEFPLRIAEFGRVHRKEKSGVTHGLLRVKGFTQDDAHIFLTGELLEDEIVRVLDFALFVYEAMGFDDVRLELSTRPAKSIGYAADWAMAEAGLQAALERGDKPWRINAGDGAFYGPKIDCHVRDALGRSWQLGTVQVDFALPKRFELRYTTPEGNPAEPIMIHRAIFGSIERFFGILIEQWAGAFPGWLAPVQALVLTVTDKQNDYAREVVELLRERGLRAESDTSSQRIGKKIALGSKLKAPYLLIVGEREEEGRSVNLRPRGDGGAQESQPLAEFADRLASEMAPPA